MRRIFNPYGAAGLALAATFAVTGQWSLPEFCWSTWLAGLAYTWSCVITGSLQIILAARSDKPAYDRQFPFLKPFTPITFLLLVTVAGVSCGLIAFWFYTFLFGFFGVFLSVFSEMEPVSLFGRNGFINSDFFTPLIYLTDRFWPMAAGVLIANWEDLVRKNPWKRVLLPFQKEVLRLHIMIVVLPVFWLLAWAIFGMKYQPVTIALLMGLFYLLPKTKPKDDATPNQNTGTAGFDSSSGI